jgi:hypothetical protein
MTNRLKWALEESAVDFGRLHQRLFFALWRDLTELAALENSVDSIALLDLIGDYAAGEFEAPKPDRNRLKPPI